MANRFVPRDRLYSTCTVTAMDIFHVILAVALAASLLYIYRNERDKE